MTDFEITSRKRLSESKDNSQILPPLFMRKRNTSYSVSSRNSSKSGTHDLFVRNRETLVELIVRKLRQKYID